MVLIKVTDGSKLRRSARLRPKQLEPLTQPYPQTDVVLSVPGSFRKPFSLLTVLCIL